MSEQKRSSLATQPWVSGSLDGPEQGSSRYRPSPGTVFRTPGTSGKLNPRPSPSLRWPERSWTHRRVRQEEGARVVRTSRLRTGTRTERSPGTSPGPAGRTDPTLSSPPHSEVLDRLSPDMLSYWRREGTARLSLLFTGCPLPGSEEAGLGCFRIASAGPLQATWLKRRVRPSPCPLLARLRPPRPQSTASEICLLFALGRCPRRRPGALQGRWEARRSR